MNRTLVALGIVLLLAGLLWPALRRVPLFRLPGDFVIHRSGFTLFFPLTSLLLLSLLVSLIAWLLRR
jgi:Protein of unknown function (DUF2905)